jgi:hypothetical protein
MIPHCAICWPAAAPLENGGQASLTLARAGSDYQAPSFFNHELRGGYSMDDKTTHSRRTVIKAGVTAFAVAPLVGLSTEAFATQNTAVRAALKFQTSPNGEKQCSKCINFLPNKDKPHNDVAVNGCKLYPGDTEICPHCYCNGFVLNPNPQPF